MAYHDSLNINNINMLRHTQAVTLNCPDADFYTTNHAHASLFSTTSNEHMQRGAKDAET
jgi:hypothetical protein